MKTDREVYINFKRRDNLRMGKTEKECEENIQAYLQWRERRDQWETSESISRRLCSSCQRASTKFLSPAGTVCFLCFMTKDRCNYIGCNRLASYKKRYCLDHSRVVTMEDEDV